MLVSVVAIYDFASIKLYTTQASDYTSLSPPPPAAGYSSGGEKTFHLADVTVWRAAWCLEKDELRRETLGSWEWIAE